MTMKGQASDPVLKAVDGRTSPLEVWSHEDSETSLVAHLYCGTRSAVFHREGSGHHQQPELRALGDTARSFPRARRLRYLSVPAAARLGGARWSSGYVFSLGDR